MSEVINPTGEQLYLATKHTHDSSGEVINPATKELQEEVSQKLEQVKAAIEEIQLGGDVATETTLAQVKAELEAIKARLDEGINGSVEVTNLPETQQVTGTVQVENWPTVQQVVGEVQVTNLPEVQQVTVTEPLPVSINGNIVTPEDTVKVTSYGGRTEKIQLWERGIYTGGTSGYHVNTLDVPVDVKRVVIVMTIYGVTGSFGENEGYRLSIRNLAKTRYFTRIVADSSYSTVTGNGSGVFFVIDPAVNEKDTNGRYKNIADVLFPLANVYIHIKGEFEEGEGIDCDVEAYFVY